MLGSYFPFRSLLFHPALGRWVLALALVAPSLGLIACGDSEPPGEPADSAASSSTDVVDGAAATDGRADSASAPDSEGPLMVDGADQLGIDFVHRSGAGGDLTFPEMMGGGIAVFDADQDGDLDLYFVSGAPNLGKSAGADGPKNRLFLQDNGKFTDRTDGSGLGDGGYGTGVAVGDVNNDGRDDVFVANIGADRLYLGQGEGKFKDATREAGLRAESDWLRDWSTSAAFCDIDRDGFLDLYVVRYVIYDPSVKCTDKAGRREYCGPSSFENRTDRLWHNQGDGTFRDITEKAGLGTANGAGLGVVCEDVDDDGWTDIYVANDGDPNQLWMNQQDGTFIDDALIMGSSVNAAGLYEAGMGVVAADFDNDADFDLFITHLRDETNTFYRNLGQGIGFEDHTSQVGLAVASTPYTGFGTAPYDLDLDGDLDLVIANGRVTRGSALTDRLGELWNPYGEPNLIYLNEAGRFVLTPDAGPDFTGPVEVSRGLATGDLNGDGALDLVVSHIESPAGVFLGRADGHWLIVDAVDPSLNRRALGARVTVESTLGRQVRTVQGASSYLSSSDPRAHFGLGTVDSIDNVIVRWPDGEEETFVGPALDQAVVLRRGEGAS